MFDNARLRFLGVGNASAHELGNASAVIEDDDGQPALLIDCGPTVLPAFLARYRTLPRALFITHTHLDHVGGLENLFYRLATGADVRERPVRLYVPVPIIQRLHDQLAEDPYKLAEGGRNFWDCFQLVPVGDHFWHDGLLFDVFPVDHHGYRSAFGLGLAERFVYTGDTRPVPAVLARFAARGETVFHDCAEHGNPSHTGLADLAPSYPPMLRNRFVLYHYESTAAATALRRAGYRVATPGAAFSIPAPRETRLRRVG